MPELPEVETIRRDLGKVIVGLKIKNVEVRKPKMIEGSAKKFIKVLSGAKVEKISRIGKLMYIQIGKEPIFLLLHLGMTGQVVYRATLTPDPSPARSSRERGGLVAGGHYTADFQDLPNKHTHIIFTFSDGSQLFFNDQRQFGYAEVVDAKKMEVIKKRYGIEPLQKNFLYADFVKIFKKRKAPVKAVLLNQNLISGIGNIYADEILFAAGVRPERAADALKEAELKKIFAAAEKIIAKSIEYRGTTFSDYRDASGQPGNFVRFLKVYGRAGKECLGCGGVVRKIRVAGRGTSYCPQCQK